MPSKPKVYKPVNVGKDFRPKGAESTWGNGRGGRPWRRKRARVLRRDSYECQECLRESGRHIYADEVDHIAPLFEGGSDDESNLEAICKEHHRKKTAAESKRGSEKKRYPRMMADLIY